MQIFNTQRIVFIILQLRIYASLPFCIYIVMFFEFIIIFTIFVALFSRQRKKSLRYVDHPQEYFTSIQQPVQQRYYVQQPLSYSYNRIDHSESPVSSSPIPSVDTSISSVLSCEKNPFSKTLPLSATNPQTSPKFIDLISELPPQKSRSFSLLRLRRRHTVDSLDPLDLTPSVSPLPERKKERNRPSEISKPTPSSSTPSPSSPSNLTKAQEDFIKCLHPSQPNGRKWKSKLKI